MEKEILQAAILSRLSQVIDPETGADVVRMRLIEDLQVDDQGQVSYKIRPSSELCPLALPLSMSILSAVKEVEGVAGQKLEIVGYIHAEALTELLRDLLHDSQYS